MQYAFFNNNLISKDEAKTSIDDRGYQFGDGVYEVIRIYKGVASLFDEHMTRLYRSSSEIGIPLLYTKEELLKMVNKLISLNQVDDGMVYMQLTRGVMTRTHTYPNEPIIPQLYAYTQTVNRPINEMNAGVSVSFAEDIRWLRCDIKSLNLLGNVMAKQAAVQNGHYEAVFVRGESITEGSASNFYIVKNNTLITHPVNNFILNGITRMKIIELAKSANIPVIERCFTQNDVMQADEAILSSTINEVMPVVQVDDTKISSSPGEISSILRHRFELDQVPS